MKKTIKQYLFEMPYFEFGDDNIYDLEIEQYNSNPKEFVKKIERILNGEKINDKYGNEIQLKSKSDKIKLFDYLEDNFMVNKWMKDKYIYKSVLKLKKII